MPDISIILPLYNAEQHLPQCIESILAQRYENFELILVDDGSPDRCGEICDNYAKKDARIRVIHQENAGVSAARNAGIDAARGRYVMFCDGDDWFENNWCECLHEAVKGEDVVMAVCGYKERKRGETSLRVFGKPDGKLKLSEMFGVSISGAPWNKIYIREQIIKHNIRFPEGISYGEDARFTYAYLSTFDGEREVYFSSLAPNNYRVEAGSLSHRYIKDFWNLEKELITLRIECARAHGVKVEECTEETANYFFRLVISSIRNLFSEENNSPRSQKYKEFKEIIYSEEFEKMKNSRAFKSQPLWWRALHKKRLLPLLYVCHSGRSIK